MTDHSEKAPLASLVIPCRNEADSIERCLRSILGAEQPEGHVEVIVADGMSSDGTRAILEKLRKQEPRVRIIDNAARVASAGLNAAIKAARGKFIIRMDAHAEYAPDYVKQCVDALKQINGDNVGGPA